jgi:hypothetical protein
VKFLPAVSPAQSPGAGCGQHLNAVQNGVAAGDDIADPSLDGNVCRDADALEWLTIGKPVQLQAVSRRGRLRVRYPAAVLEGDDFQFEAEPGAFDAVPVVIASLLHDLGIEQRSSLPRPVPLANFVSPRLP